MILASFPAFLASIPVFWTLIGIFLAAVALGFLEAPLWGWSLALAVLLLGAGAPFWLWVVLGVPALILNLGPVRRVVVTRPLMKLFKILRFLPRISETERIAIEAGTVWVDGELFSGKPDLDRLLAESWPELTAEEQAFLDGPVESVCRMVNDWEVTQRRDLSPETWEFLKKERFFGLIIPKEYGGLGFSASGNSAVVARCSSVSMPLAISVMVPNSLGPAELLVHYGTKEQKEHYLPKLATGEEMPCFALTEPGAGSDAGSMTSNGAVFRGDDGGLYLKLNWDKRYITLASIATVLGLAFKLRDPENLLGKGENPGITCALIPTDTPGVEHKRRHDPLNVPFINCPTTGKDVVVPVDAIIGGVEGTGQGWKMLMETLAAGRGISLPASCTGGVRLAARVAGAYAAVRKQFGLPIGKFEGIEEPLARIGGFAYLLEAARRFTCGGLDTGARPSVVTAMAKYNFTETLRKAVNDAMDVLGGAAISRGPRNLLANAYTGLPVSITVEGANILTRTLMIFGQGAIRCHPYAYREIKSFYAGDAAAFDQAFFGHVGLVVRNACRALVLSVSRGRLAHVPIDGPAVPYLRRLAWSSASFAFLADFSMAALGGDLKRRETVTGRFSDVFSWMYLATAVLRRFEAEGRRERDLPFFHWTMEYAFARIQEGFDGLFRNLDPPGLGWLFRGPVALWSRLNPVGSGPRDELGHGIARVLQTPGRARDALTRGLFVPSDPEHPLGRLENAFRLCVEADGVARRIRAAVKAGTLPRKRPEHLIEPALEAGILTPEEADLMRRAEAARDDLIQVDSFTLEEYLATAAGARKSETHEAALR